jgi:hypothetical protein
MIGFAKYKLSNIYRLNDGRELDARSARAFCEHPQASALPFTP